MTKALILLNAKDKFEISKSFLLLAVCNLTLLGCSAEAPPEKILTTAPAVMYVEPTQSIQEVLNEAADRGCKKVVVRSGVYRPDKPSQALIYFNRKHTGIHLLAEGSVVLTAENAEVADIDNQSYPAVVNHVVYLGDGLGEETVIDGFKITGANGFQTTSGTDQIQPETGHEQLARERFFFSDGGGVKVFGRSSPTLRNLVIENNHADPCGGGVSIEQRGFRDKAVAFDSCIFRSNSCRLTGSAADLLPGSSATFVNCLFLGNHGNNGVDDVSEGDVKYNAEHGCGALTVFPESRAEVIRCTFTGNRNGVDDKGRSNVYRDCLFWQNDLPGGTPKGGRYEANIIHAVNVVNCHFGAQTPDLVGSINPDANVMRTNDPRFNDQWVPTSDHLSLIGYRPSPGLLNSTVE